MAFAETRRKALTRLIDWLALCCFPVFLPLRRGAAKGNLNPEEVLMKLPPPETRGAVSVAQAIHQRRTVRSFLSKPLALKQVSQLLWATHGITENGGLKRAAPSAGALYPMDIYAVVGEGNVTQLEAGVYHYKPREHALSQLKKGDICGSLARASLSQMWMARAPMNVVITAEYSRVTGKYGDRGVRYAMIEAGHMGQNLFLQAEALGLKVGIVGAFMDRDVTAVMTIPTTHEPLLIMPVGYSK